MTSNTNLTVTAIDLGASSAKIAAVLKGGVQIITNQANFRQTPNLVAFTSHQRLIGQSAQLKIKSNFSNTVTAPSRFLGFNLDCPYLQQELKFFPAKTLNSEKQNSLTFDLLYNNQRQPFTAQQLVASYLTEMEKIIAHTNNLSNKNLVISVPTYFSQHERQALMDAVEICKKKLNNQYPTQLVNEEIAISMDYGYSKRNDFSDDLQKAHKVLFIDLGHSKTNLFVTAFNKQHLRVVANKFDRQLGCKFLDQEMLKFYANQFDSAHPNLQLNLMESKKAVLKLLENIEKQRKVLTGIFDHDLNIECLLEDEDLFYSMNRQKYENICRPVIQKFKNILKCFSDELKQKGIQFDTIELIGGGTRIPATIRAITQVFESEPRRTTNSSECVAKGAALISAMNSSIFKVQPYSYFTISPYSIEMKVNGQRLGKILVQRNEVILREKSIELDVGGLGNNFTLSAEYSSQNLEKGLETRLFECLVSVAKTSKDLSQMKQEGQETLESKLVIQIEFDESGLIRLQNIRPLNSQTHVQISGLNYFPKFTPSQITQMETQEKEMTLRDFKIKKFYDKKNELESFIYQSKHSLQNLLSSHSHYISQTKIHQIQTYLDTQQNWLNEGFQIPSEVKLEIFDHKQKQINHQIQQFTLSVNQTKQNHLMVDSELQKLTDLIKEIISNRSAEMYPDDVNKVGEWINEVKEKINSSPKWALPIVSVQEIKQVYEKVVKRIKDFDMEMVRERQTKSRVRQQRSNQGGFYRPHESSQNLYSSGREYEDDYYKPRTTRNRGHKTNYNPFGSFFGSGFSSFF